MGTADEVAGYGVSLVEDSRGRTVALFGSATTLARLLERHPNSVVPIGIDASEASRFGS